MTQYIDPNSGAAPQPGGWAGIEGMERGHALPADLPEDGVEQKRQLNEALYETPEEKTVQEVADEAAENKGETTDEDEALQERVEAMANPTKYLADLDEGDSASTTTVPEPGDEEEAVNAKALETEAVNLDEETENADEEASEAYDPSQYNVDEVLAYVEANPEQKDAVLAAEEAGKNRKGVVDALKG